MMTSTANPFDGHDGKVEKLLRSVPCEAVELFSTLAAPAQGRIDGDYAGAVGRYLNEDWEMLMSRSGLGTWLGKRYTSDAADGTRGEGCNLYRREGGVGQSLRFAWHIGPSTIDGRPALMMHYGAFDNWAGRQDLVDELRVWRDDLLLGLFHTGEPVPNFTAEGEGERSAVGFFVLKGPASKL